MPLEWGYVIVKDMGVCLKRNEEREDWREEERER